MNMGIRGKCFNKRYGEPPSPCPLFMQQQDTDDGLCATCRKALKAPTAPKFEAPKTPYLKKKPTLSGVVEKKSTAPRQVSSTSTSLPPVEMISARELTKPANLPLRDAMHVEVKGRGKLFGQLASPSDAPTLKVRVGGTTNQHVWVNAQDVVPHPTLQAMREDEVSREAFSQALCRLTCDEQPRLHIIWFGSALPEARMKALDTWISAFDPGLQVYVWADSRVRGWDAINSQFFGKSRCKVFDASVALAAACQAMWTDAYEKEIGLRPRMEDAECFVASAAASDVLRLVVVYLYGGLYLDMDMPMARDWKKRNISFPLNEHGFALLRWQNGHPVNAGMAARPNSPKLAKVIHAYVVAMANYLSLYLSDKDLQLITQTMRENHDKWTEEMPVFLTAKNFTMFRTGPDVLNGAVTMVLGAPMITWERNYQFAVEGMHYGNELSWLSPRAMWFP
ncbi:hypothetical protein D7Y27_00980 [Corallococcus sp. AB004]|nr:hypothetical protein D7Y27_00980 [Corallococcus sp. AB004]